MSNETSTDEILYSHYDHKKVDINFKIGEEKYLYADIRNEARISFISRHFNSYLIGGIILEGVALGCFLLFVVLNVLGLKIIDAIFFTFFVLFFLVGIFVLLYYSFIIKYYSPKNIIAIKFALQLNSIEKARELRNRISFRIGDTTILLPKILDKGTNRLITKSIDLQSTQKVTVLIQQSNKTIEWIFNSPNWLLYPFKTKFIIIEPINQI
ncbi:MAG: hypothetical protein ACXAC7_03250 [Candidatus Hodarchaeales archaeon]|jgi:hypothetical protein